MIWSRQPHSWGQDKGAQNKLKSQELGVVFELDRTGFFVDEIPVHFIRTMFVVCWPLSSRSYSSYANTLFLAGAQLPVRLKMSPRLSHEQRVLCTTNPLLLSYALRVSTSRDLRVGQELLSIGLQLGVYCRSTQGLHRHNLSVIIQMAEHSKPVCLPHIVIWVVDRFPSSWWMRLWLWLREALTAIEEVLQVYYGAVQSSRHELLSELFSSVRGLFHAGLLRKMSEDSCECCSSVVF